MTMAAPAAIPAPPSVVGNAFVNQYYNVLHHSPQVVHRFYTDESKLSRAEASLDAIVETVIGQAGIHEKVMSLDYGDSRAEIRSIDSQESLNGSVLVMVTGGFPSQNSQKRSFVQTFFLAPQENGYFVLNDMFRYVDEVCSISPVPSLANGTSDRAPSNPGSVVSDEGLETHVLDDADESVAYDHTQQVPEDIHDDPPPKIEASSQVQEADEPTSVPEEESAVASSEPAVPPSSVDVTEELPKKSYASILRVPKDSPGASSAKDSPGTSAVKTTMPVQGRNTPIQAAQVAQSMAEPIRPEEADESSQPYNEGPNGTNVAGDPRSVYVRNLALNVTAKELEDELSRFGKIKPGGVNLRNQKPGVCFAFVEYEETTFAQIAIEASPITIGGRPAYIQEKRPGGLRAVRGRFPQGRGYQNEGFRGRGYFGGRGTGRGNWQDSERDFNKGRGSVGTGRGGYGAGNNSSYYGNGNGYRRFDNQSGATVRFPRRGMANHEGHGASRGAATNVTA